MESEIKVKIISMEDIVSSGCCQIDRTISVIEKALIDYKSGKILLPEKISQVFEDDLQERINCMPSTLLEEKICGVKWVSVFPENPRKFSRPNVSGLIILSEIEKGFPFAVLDGSLITAFRTACMGAIGAKYLACKDSHIYATIGTGSQAKAHFIVIKHLFPEIKTCYVASRSHESEKAFSDLMKKKYTDVEFIECHSDYEAAVKEADIIVTAVSCQKPLLRAENIKEGTYYCHVGGWEDEYAVPLKADKIICDNWEALKHRGSPTIARMYREGYLKDADIYANLADVIDGTKAGRVSEKEFIYFNSIGLSFVDISVANDFYKQVLKKDAGNEWSMQSSDMIEAFMSNI